MMMKMLEAGGIAPLTDGLREANADNPQQSNLTYMDVEYNQALQSPRSLLLQVKAFLGLELDVKAMAAVVDPNLYRQRAEKR